MLCRVYFLLSAFLLSVTSSTPNHDHRPTGREIGQIRNDRLEPRRRRPSLERRHRRKRQLSFPVERGLPAIAAGRELDQFPFREPDLRRV